MHAQVWAVILLAIIVALIGWRLWREFAGRKPVRRTVKKRDPAKLTPEAALDGLTAISPAGRARLRDLLALEKRITAEAAAGPVTLTQLAGYLDAMAAAGDDIDHHIVKSTIAVRQGTFRGEITAGDGDGWRLAGRARDLGQDHDFASTEDLIWRGLSPTGRPGDYVLALYAKES